MYERQAQVISHNNEFVSNVLFHVLQNPLPLFLLSEKKNYQWRVISNLQGCLFVNNGDQPLTWTLHTKAAGTLMEDGTFKFLHRTGSPFTPSSAGKKSVIPDITLDSGETFNLGVLFTPRKIVCIVFVERVCFLIHNYQLNHWNSWHSLKASN